MIPPESAQRISDTKLSIKSSFHSSKTINNKDESPSIIFIILNWNSARDSCLCAESLIPQLEANQKIVVVDNGSTDNSINEINEKFPEIDILKNSKNLGFQGGMNIGINYAINNGAEYVMLLNSDTIASPDMMEILLTLSPLDAAIVSPGIYYYKNQNQLCSTGGKINNILLDTLRKAKIRNPSEPLKLEFLPSHAWLIRTEIFKKSGLFDESYFPLYYDDLDFCLRLKRLGFSLYLIPAAKIYHNVSVSVGGKNSPKERYLMARNSGYYYRKNMRFWQAPLIFLFRLISAILWTFRLLKDRNYESIKSYWKGFFTGWFGKLPQSTTKIN